MFLRIAVWAWDRRQLFAECARVIAAFGSGVARWAAMSLSHGGVLPLVCQRKGVSGPAAQNTNGTEERRFAAPKSPLFRFFQDLALFRRLLPSLGVIRVGSAGRAALACRATAVVLYHRSIDGHARAVNGDEVAAHHQRQRRGGLDHHRVPLEADRFARLEGVGTINLDLQVLGDLQRIAFLDLGAAVPTHFQSTVAADGFTLLLLDGNRHVAAVGGVALADQQLDVALDVFDLVALDLLVLVLVDQNALVALFILFRANDLVAVAEDALAVIVFHAQVVILFGMD